MEIRFSTNPQAFSTMTQSELRENYLIDFLFIPDAIPMVYSDIDRSITGSAVPVKERLQLLSSKKEMAAEYFTERREIGVINIGGPGTIALDARNHSLAHRDGMYIGRGTKEIFFVSEDPNTPAAFYFVSYPAHKEYPSSLVPSAQAAPNHLGCRKDANERTIYKYFHPGGVKSCQLVMGLTELDEGSVWNTMPPHTHQRRSEVYMYFNLQENAVVFHMMGRPEETRHIVMRNRQAVLSPSWSIHAGVATQAYTFIWAMGGENQAFDDMDGVAMGEIF